MNQTVSDIEESDMTQWLSYYLPSSEILDPEPFLFTYGAAQHNQRNVWDIENIQYKYFFSLEKVPQDFSTVFTLNMKKILPMIDCSLSITRFVT